MKKLAVAVSLLVLLASSAGSTVRSDRDAALDREEYEVYSALILQSFIKNGTRLIIVTDPTCCDVSTISKDNLSLSLEQLSTLSQDTLENFIHRNKETTHLKRSFTLSVPYRVVDYKRIEKLFDMIELEKEWKTFYRWYPGSNGYIRLSRVGFNKARNQALVSTGWMSGELSGEGRYFLLSRNGSKWHVQGSVTTWVS